MSGQRLLHVAFVDDWEPARRFGEYEASTRGETLDDAGFIHATTRSQLPQVLRDVYEDLELRFSSSS